MTASALGASVHQKVCPYAAAPAAGPPPAAPVSRRCRITTRTAAPNDAPTVWTVVIALVARGISPAARPCADRGLLDPLEAAGHLGALVTNAVSLRSLVGAYLVDEAEVDRIVTGGVRVFVRAYRPDPD
jgi:hypothetical protein